MSLDCLVPVCVLICSYSHIIESTDDDEDDVNILLIYCPCLCVSLISQTPAAVNKIRTLLENKPEYVSEA